MDNPMVEGVRRSRIVSDPEPVTVADPDAVVTALVQEIAALGAPGDLPARAAAARRVVAVGLGCHREDLEVLGRSRLMDVLAVTGERAELLDELAVVHEVSERQGGVAQGRAQLLLASQALLDGRFADVAAHTARAVACSPTAPDVVFLESVMGFALARMTGEGLTGFVARVQEVVATMPFAARGWLAMAHLSVGDRLETARLWESLRSFATRLPPTAPEFLVAAASNAELATWLEDAETADALYAMLRPHAGLQVIGSAAGPYEGPVDLALGRLARGLGQRTAAREHLHRALAQCRSLHAVPHEAIVQREIALLEGPGTREGLDAAGGALALAQRLGMAPLEASLVGRTRRTDSPLTPRELDVAALVAQDCSNAEIARRLHLSERTVENHVRSALLKIGGASRTALALWHARTAHR